MAEDPERLIAEALRAQAARTPLPEPPGRSDHEATQRNAAPGLGLAGSGYGLLSGTGRAPALSTRPTRPVARTGAQTNRIEPARRVPVVAILLFALTLGLAAGAVVGLLTLL